MSPPKKSSRKAFAQIVSEQIQPPFRGEIWEFFQNTAMARGFANEGKPFDIETAAYLKEPMREIRRRPHGKFVIKAAVQMLKTNGTIEQPSGYFIANDPGDMVIYLSGDFTAFDQAKARAMPYLKSNPKIAKMIDAVREQGPDGRHQITTSEFYLPGMVLRIWPLNITTTQRMTLRYVFISDAFLTQKTGLIKEAIARTTQHNTAQLKDYKIVLESQGSEEGDDFDEEWKTTDQRMLSVVCPICGMGQLFEWHRQRPDDFVATPPKAIPSLDHPAWINHFTPILKSPARHHCGMKRGDEATVKVEDVYNEKEIIRQTHYECYHCGETWLDTKETRRQLDQSSHYIPTNDRALYENVGWSWPAWGGQRIPWGSVMLEYLNAKQAQRMGNLHPLMIWYQKRAASTWSQNMANRSQTYAITAGSYETDPAKRSFGDKFHCRQMTVDCGKALDAEVGDKRIGTFWFDIGDWSKEGNYRQLARGFVDSWELLAAQQRHWKVPCARTFVDSAWMPSQVEEAAVRFFELEPISPMMKVPRTWRLMMGAGSGRRLAVNNKGVSFIENKLPGIRSAHDESGRLWRMWLFKITWANLWFEQQFESILGGGVDVKWEILPIENMVIVDVNGHPSESLLATSRDRETKQAGKHASYQDQLQSRYYSDKTRKFEDYEKQSRPTEYRDCALMQLVGVAADGLLGHVSPKGIEAGES